MKPRTRTASVPLAVVVVLLLAGCTGKLTGGSVAEIPPACGDGTCANGENSYNCPVDCGEEPGANDAIGDAASASPDGATSDGPPSSVVPWSFFAISDTRSDMELWGTAVNSMAALDPDAIALFDAGDIVADGRDYQWQEHKQIMADNAPDPLAVHDCLFRADLTDWDDEYVRFVGVLGNHDVHVSEWRENWERFLPGQADLGMGGQVFHLTYANAMFIVLDSLHGDVSVEDQEEWLESILQSPEATAATWKFAFFHTPVYLCVEQGWPKSELLGLVTIFERYNVDMVFVGDSHSFERTCQMRGGRCEDGGVIYMNTASAGAEGRTPTRDLDRVVHGEDRTDAYSCSEILDSDNDGDYYPGSDSSFFCHIEITGAELALNCYFHDDISLPYSTLILSK